MKSMCVAIVVTVVVNTVLERIIIAVVTATDVDSVMY